MPAADDKSLIRKPVAISLSLVPANVFESDESPAAAATSTVKVVLHLVRGEKDGGPGLGLGAPGAADAACYAHIYF